MQKVEVEVFSDAVNAWVVRTPGRQYPALVIQGDTFSNFFALAQELLERVRKIGDSDSIDTAAHLRDRLWEQLHHYEDVLSANGFQLPYNRVLWPK